jgi:hypothetical protein
VRRINRTDSAATTENSPKAEGRPQRRASHHAAAGKHRAAKHHAGAGKHRR